MTAIRDLNTGSVLASELRRASTFLGRLVGLLGHSLLPAGEGLMLERCRSVHTLFMRFPIDVAYLDRDLWVVAVYPDVKPWRVLPGVKDGEHTLELPAGALEKWGVKVGHKLECFEAG